MELIVGKKIELLREDGGMSQGELAKVLGVTRQTVSKWEADVCRPKVKVLQAICGVFGVDMSYFTGEEDLTPQQICTLGEFIRKLRRRAKLSQEQFAERMGVSRRMISLWETDEVKPRARVLQKLGECFCMDEEERQQLQRLAAAERAQSPAAEERAQSPAAEEGADGRALADAAEDNCGQDGAENAARQGAGEFAAEQGAEDRLAVEFAAECAAAAAPPAEAFTGDAQLFALQGAAVPIAEWAVSPAEEEACAKPKARRKPWAAVAALSAAMLLVIAVAVILICTFYAPQKGDQSVQTVIWGLSSRGVIVLVSIVAALLLAGGAALMARLLKNKKKAECRPKVGKKFSNGGN